jgi:hypothetical protein
MREGYVKGIIAFAINVQSAYHHIRGIKPKIKVREHFGPPRSQDTMGRILVTEGHVTGMMQIQSKNDLPPSFTCNAYTAVNAGQQVWVCLERNSALVVLHTNHQQHTTTCE